MLGDSQEGKRVSDDGIQGLKNELAALSSRSNLYFWMCASMIVILLVLALVLIFYWVDAPGKLQIIFGASGLSVGGLIYYMNKLWKEKVSTDLILILVSTVQQEVINSILVALVNKL